MKKLIVLTLSLTVLTNIATAAEVYINQAGGNIIVDILQENGMNRINTESDPAIIDGDDILLNMIQNGDQNTADLYFAQNANSTDYTYSATGSFNEVITHVFGGLNNYFAITITGDTNIVSACKSLYSTTCNGIIVNNTQNTIEVTGNNNEVNLALDSGDAINTISIGDTVPSDFNTINLTQTGVGAHVATINLNGDNNLIDIVQN